MRTAETGLEIGRRRQGKGKASHCEKEIGKSMTVHFQNHFTRHTHHAHAPMVKNAFSIEFSPANLQYGNLFSMVAMIIDLRSQFHILFKICYTRHYQRKPHTLTVIFSEAEKTIPPFEPKRECNNQELN